MERGWVWWQQRGGDAAWRHNRVKWLLRVSRSLFLGRIVAALPKSGQIPRGQLANLHKVRSFLGGNFANFLLSRRGGGRLETVATVGEGQTND